MMKKKKIFYGWWMVWACGLLNLFIGGVFFYGGTIFFNPIRNTFNWTAAATSVAFVFQRLESGLLAPMAGIMVDRLGPRKMMLAGWVVIGLGFVMMSRIQTLWAFYGTFICIAAGTSFGTYVVMNAAVVNWFTKKRSRAMAWIYGGFGVSGILVPVVGVLITAFDWRMTLVIIGISAWVLGIPLSLVMRHKPQAYGYLPDGNEAPKSGGAKYVIEVDPENSVNHENTFYQDSDVTSQEALKTKVFWMVSLTFLFQHLTTSAVMVHIAPYLESVKVSKTLAEYAVAGMTVCSLIGRMGFGYLGDFASKRHLIAFCLLLQTIGIVIFSFVDGNRVWLLIPFLLLYAPGYGGPIPLRPAMVADYFGTGHFGTILGVMATISMVGGLMSPVFAGWIFDITGGYTLAWRVLALTSLPGIPLMFFAKPPKR